ncbi:MAG: glycosyltransferase family 2 protein [Acidobacteria bacterium]|nr:glycosyltransferase family 2 protein [Acidobacteriota bacterium]
MISVVIPVANEQTTIEPLCRALEQAAPSPYEILFVDDGSTDGTWEEITKLHQAGRARGIRFRRNFGKTAALQAGFAATRGDVVFTLDGDLQDDPQEIPRFLEMLEQGCDLVSGWKKHRQDPFTKVIASRVFNVVVRWVSGVKLHDINCGFKAYRGELARALPLQGDWHRFTPLLAHAMGYRVGELVVTHHPRRHGRSHYGVSRLFKGFLDLITVMLVTRYEQRPSHGFGLAALVAVAAGVVLLVLPWWPYLILGVACLVSAVVLLAAGLVAEILVYRAPATPSCRIREQLD